MRLYLLRHATAAPHGSAAQDADRPLTEEGHEEARGVALGLKRLELGVAVILTSPYVRAKETAQHAADVLGPGLAIKPVRVLEPEADPRQASMALQPFAGAAQLLCVGHEPHLSAWIAELVSGAGLRCQMKKAGVACIEIGSVPPPSGSGTLRWLLTPKQLTMIGRAG